MKKTVNIETNTKILFNTITVALLITQFVFICIIFVLKFLMPAVICIFLFIIFDIIFFIVCKKTILEPLETIRNRIKSFNKGEALQEIYRTDVIIMDEFPWVLEKFKHLINTGNVLELSIKQAQYLALQNQINPHFLYNTLDAIRTDALIAGINQVADTIEALSAYFRYTVTNIDKYGTLAEELGSIKDYMTIQQYRFGENLKLDIENIDDSLMHNLLPRMTLQPLVENAIYHGLEAKRKKGTVSISAHVTEDLLILNVSDDGCGMDIRAVDKLNAYLGRADSEYITSEKKKGGIALRNVQSRIKLLFGEEYGMQIFSEIGVGTTIRILIPIMTDRKDEEER